MMDDKVSRVELFVGAGLMLATLISAAYSLWFWIRGDYAVVSMAIGIMLMVAGLAVHYYRLVVYPLPVEREAMTGPVEDTAFRETPMKISAERGRV